MTTTIPSVLLIFFLLLFSQGQMLAQNAAAPTPETQTQINASTLLHVPAKAPVENPPAAGQVLIGSGDLLETSIFGADYSCGSGEKPTGSAGCQVRVSNAGEITLPLVGRVKVAGLTVEEAQDLVARHLVEGEFYKDPQVTIIQKEYSTQGISVLGEVQKPGIYSLLGPHTLLQAISAAGGTTVKAGNHISVTHRDHLDRSEELDLNQPSASKTLVHPGDVIVVSKAGIVYVVGDVRQPSGVVMESSGLTVLQAIAMAQGANSTAALNKAKLIRSTPQGRQEIPIPLQKILSSKAIDIPLQAEDILFIPSSAAKSAARRSMEAILQTATGVAIYRR